MKISEAIEKALPLGIPQYVGAYFGLNEQGSLCACALGQAMIGAGIITPADAKELVQRAVVNYGADGYEADNTELDGEVTRVVEESVAKPRAWAVRWPDTSDDRFRDGSASGSLFQRVACMNDNEGETLKGIAQRLAKEGL